MGRLLLFFVATVIVMAIAGQIGGIIGAIGAVVVMSVVATARINKKPTQ